MPPAGREYAATLHMFFRIYAKLDAECVASGVAVADDIVEFFKGQVDRVCIRLLFYMYSSFLQADKIILSNGKIDVMDKFDTPKVVKVRWHLTLHLHQPVIEGQYVRCGHGCPHELEG